MIRPKHKPIEVTVNGFSMLYIYATICYNTN